MIFLLDVLDHIHLETLYSITVSTMHDIIRDIGVTITRGNPTAVNEIGTTIPAKNIKASFFFVIFSNINLIIILRIKG